MAALTAALEGQCPRCGERTLFAGAAAFAARCRACGLDFAGFNVGDGPAAFLILIVGAILTAAAISVELAFEAPWWVHLVWIPLGLFLTLAGLRVAKALLIAREFHTGAGA
jgi:uncharacterized protein (DUF983 family)